MRRLLVLCSRFVRPARRGCGAGAGADAVRCGRRCAGRAVARGRPAAADQAVHAVLGRRPRRQARAEGRVAGGLRQRWSIRWPGRRRRRSCPGSGASRSRSRPPICTPEGRRRHRAEGVRARSTCRSTRCRSASASCCASRARRRPSRCRRRRCATSGTRSLPAGTALDNAFTQAHALCRRAQRSAEAEPVVVREARHHGRLHQAVRRLRATPCRRSSAWRSAPTATTRSRAASAT